MIDDELARWRDGAGFMDPASLLLVNGPVVFGTGRDLDRDGTPGDPAVFVSLEHLLRARPFAVAEPVHVAMRPAQARAVAYRLLEAAALAET